MSQGNLKICNISFPVAICFWLILLCIIIAFSSASFAANADNNVDVKRLSQIYLAAEAENGVEAVSLWDRLLNHDGDLVLGQGVNRQQIMLNRINDLVLAATATSDPIWLEKAYSQTVDISNNPKKFWALMVIWREQIKLQPFATQRLYDLAMLLLDEAASNAKLAGWTNEQVSYAAEALVGALLLPVSQEDILPYKGEWAVERARHLTLHYIGTAFHRARALHNISLASLSYNNKEIYDELKSMGDKEKTLYLHQLSLDALNGDAFEEALLYAYAAPLDISSSKRRKLFDAIGKKAKKNSNYAMAGRAYWGVPNASKQGALLANLAEGLLKRGDVSQASKVAETISEAGKRAAVWQGLMKHYAKAGYEKRMLDAGSKAWLAVEAIRIEPRQSEKRMEYAKAVAEVGMLALAEKNFNGAKEASDASIFKTALAISKAYASKGDIENAYKWLSKIPKDKQEKEAKKYGKILSDIIRGLIKKKDFSLAEQKLIDNSKYIPEKEADKLNLKLLKSYVKLGDIDKAKQARDRLHGVSVKIESMFLMKKLDNVTIDKIKTDSNLLINSLPNNKKHKSQAKLATLLVENNDAKSALEIVKKLENNKAIHTVKRSLAKHSLAVGGDIDNAMQFAQSISNEAVRDKLLSELSIKLTEIQKITKAAPIVRAISNDKLRVETYHKMAVIQASHTDFYGLLDAMDRGSTIPQAVKLRVSYSSDDKMISPFDIEGNRVSDNDLSNYLKETYQLAKDSVRDLLLRDPLPSPVGRNIPPIEDSWDFIGLTDADVRRDVPSNSNHFVVASIGVESSVFNHKFVLSMGKSGFSKMQKNPLPDLLYIESGVVDLPELYVRLREMGLGDEYLMRKDKTYTLRRPILVAPEATLVISGEDVDALRLSLQYGSYIINAGSLYMVDSYIAGWNEETNKPAVTTYEHKYEFRPFIAAWSRSDTHLAGNVFEALGYANAKAYGLSFSSGPKELTEFMPQLVERPTGRVVGNSFKNMYYGFYSYEADYVHLVGNEYVENIVYGIDPHDRSQWLTIAYNTAYGTHERHGIIISREVNYSTILGNTSFENNGSGMMIDRLSSGSMIYANSSFHNEQDGLTIFESSCKLVASNRFMENKRAGIKLRNSTDVALFFNIVKDNARYGIEGYISDLTKSIASATRDFELDPYSDMVALTLIGNWVENNGIGINLYDAAALFMRKNIFVKQSPKIMRGSWTEEVPEILTRFDLDKKGAFMAARCPKGTVLHEVPCIFREQGLLAGDGQDDLMNRVANNPCVEAKK